MNAVLTQLAEEAAWKAFEFALSALPSLASWMHGVLEDADGDDPISAKIKSILPERSLSEQAADEIRAAKASP